MFAKKLVTTSIILLSMLNLAGTAAAEPWKVDQAHSTVGFKVRHMMVSNTKGEFTKFDGKVDLDDKDLTKSSVTFSVDMASVDTRDEKRDEHLRSPDFFDVTKHPQMTFISKSITKAGGAYKVSGDLTLHGVTKPATFTVELTKPVKTPFDSIARGATVSGTINRKDFGITWNKAMDAGGLAVGEEVHVNIELELIQMAK